MRFRIETCAAVSHVSLAVLPVRHGATQETGICESAGDRDRRSSQRKRLALNRPSAIERERNRDLAGCYRLALLGYRDTKRCSFATPVKRFRAIRPNGDHHLGLCAGRGAPNSTDARNEQNDGLPKQLDMAYVLHRMALSEVP